MLENLGFKKIKFNEINLEDNFFDSLNEDYPDFKEWINNHSDRIAYLYFAVDKVQGMFCFEEKEEKIKLCTLKLNKECSFHFSEIMNQLIIISENKNKPIYFTVFPKQTVLIEKMKSLGFKNIDFKGKELVFQR